MSFKLYHAFALCERFEKVMQDFNQNCRGRNLRKYCRDEGIDYKWLSEYKKQYSSILHVGLCPWHPGGAESAFPGVVPYQQGDVGPDAGCCLWCLLSNGAACRMDYPEVGLQEGSDNRTASLRYRCSDVHTGKQTASLYLAFGGMGLFFIGRLAGGVIMNYIQPRLVLLVCAILTFVATLIVVVCSGTLSLIAFFALYLGESIMFPTIFSLALRDAGTKTKLASSLLIMTIVGGAIAPVIMGYIADTTGSMAIAFLIPLVCYGVIGGYALLNPSDSL